MISRQECKGRHGLNSLLRVHKDKDFADDDPRAHESHKLEDPISEYSLESYHTGQGRSLCPCARPADIHDQERNKLYSTD